MERLDEGGNVVSSEPMSTDETRFENPTIGWRTSGR
jgi:hypothetical protein